MNPDPLDWLPLWANKDPLSLNEAAALLRDLEPRERRRVAGESDALRIEREKVEVTAARLVAAIDAGPDAPGGLAGSVPREHLPALWEPSQWSNDPPIQVRKAQTVIHYDRPAVTRDDVRAWADAQGMRPKVWEVREAESLPVVRKVAGSAAEETTDRIIAVLLCLLAERGPNLWRKNDGTPVFSQIQEAALTKAQELFAGDVRGLEACRKRLADAWKAVFRDR